MDEKFKYKWWALFGICFLAFTAYLDFTIVNTALPFIQQDLQTSILDLQWVSNIFAILLSMTMIGAGKCADRWGRKEVFYTGVVLFGIAALGAGLSPTIDFLIFFRGLQGLGGSIIFITAAALLSDAFPQKEQAKAIGIFGGITGLGLVIGPFLGGMLVGALNWRWVFWVNLPLILIGLITCIFSLRRVNPEKHDIRIDWQGLFLLTFGLGALIYGIVATGQQGWSSPFSWAPLLCGFLSLLLLGILDAKKKAPLLDLTIFKNKIVALSLISCSMAGMVTFVFMFFDPLYLENVRQLSPFAIGLFVAIIPAAQLISFFFGPILKWLGLTNIFLLSIFMGTLAILLHRFIEVDTSFLYLVLPLFLLGIPWGFSNTGMITAVNRAIAPHKIGEAIGTIATVWNVAGAIFLSISSVIFHHAGESFVPAFHTAVDVLIPVGLLACAISLAIRLKMKRSDLK